MSARFHKVFIRKSTFDIRHFPFLLLCLLPILSGCASTYELRGRVIEGPVSAVVVVDQKDPRLGESSLGLGGAMIDATLDPQRLNRIPLDPAVSQSSGAFALPVRATGAGFLEYDAELLAQLPGHAPAVGRFPLPGRSRRVLVILAPGSGQPRPARDDILDETLKMSEPYLKE